MSAGVRANSLSATSTVGTSAPAATLEERLLTLTAIPTMTSATIATAVEKYREKLRRWSIGRHVAGPSGFRHGSFRPEGRDLRPGCYGGGGRSYGECSSYITNLYLKGVPVSLISDPPLHRPARQPVPTELSTPSSEDASAGPEPVVKVRRRTIDAVLIGAGVVVTLVLVVAGSLLPWGNRFATDYVDRELSSQNIVFPDEAALVEQGRTDLVGFAGQQLNTGAEAEAYASYIDGHLADTADGATYADLGGPERAANAAVRRPRTAGRPGRDRALQEDATAISGQRNTLFKGETLRGLLLSTFAWSTVGRIAGIAAVVAFVAAGLMLVLVLLGVFHRRKTPKA